MTATQCAVPADQIGVPFSFHRTIRFEGDTAIQDTVCATCGETFSDPLDDDSKPLTTTYADHFVRVTPGTVTLPAEYTPERMAKILVRVIREDMEIFPAMFTNVSEWSDLDTVCDANDYLAEAADELGVELGAWDTPEEADAQCAVASAACDIAEKILWPTDQETV